MLNLDCFDVSYERCSEPCRIVQTHEKGYLLFEWFDILQFKGLFVLQGMDIYKSSFWSPIYWQPVILAYYGKTGLVNKFVEKLSFIFNWLVDLILRLNLNHAEHMVQV